MGKKSKHYVVLKGKKTGVFSTWDECKQYVLGFPGAKYKSFSTISEAEHAYQNGWERKSIQQDKSNIKAQQTLDIFDDYSYIEESICVDAACSGNPGAMEYQGVYTKTGKVLFHYGPILGTNNVGEFLAIVHGLGFLKEI